MKKHLILVLLTPIYSCCFQPFKKPKELEKVLLTEIDKEFIPYAIEDAQEFIHSGGYEFVLNTISAYTEFRQSDPYMHHCIEDYTTYEVQVVKLESNIPELFIEITSLPQAYTPILEISINNTNTYFSLNSLDEANLDTAIVNNQEFYNVYKLESQFTEPNTIAPSEVLYSQLDGIIQITMSNEETYSFKK